MSGSEANKRFDRIEDAWKDNEIFCQRQLVTEPNWNYIARWAAESIRKGDLRIEISADYNILNGGLMPLGLRVLLFSPMIAANLSHKRYENHPTPFLSNVNSMTTGVLAVML